MHEPRELTDVHGRSYRIGETDRELLGRSRAWVAWLCAAAMFAAGVGQYGFGVIAPSLTRAHGWTFTEVVIAFAGWAVCQASTAFPAAWLRDRGWLRPGVAVVLGGVLCAVGLVTLGHASSLALVFLGYSVAGGIGTGLVYATCVGAVLSWFPDRAATRIGVTSGAFAFGSVPFVLVAALVPGGHTGLLDVTAAVVLVVITGAGLLVRYPPAHWWPPEVDPLAPRRGTRPAIRTYRPAELFRCGVTLSLYLTVVLSAAVLLFDLAYLATFVTERTGAGTTAAALALLAAATGGGRVLLGRLKLPRPRILRLALITGGLAQFLLAYSGEHRHVAGLLVAVTLAGLGNGCCYTLLTGIVREFFGEETALQNFGVLYSAKAVGAVVGVALAAAAPGAFGAFAAAGVLSLAGALLSGRLAQPGRPRSLLPAR